VLLGHSVVVVVLVLLLSGKSLLLISLLIKMVAKVIYLSGRVYEINFVMLVRTMIKIRIHLLLGC
jgi:hypothetical protein